MSTVRSVSGLAVEVLKFGPFQTVNHWLLLHEDQRRKPKERTENSGLLNDEFPLPKVGKTLLASGKSACGVYLTEFFLGRVFY